MALHQIVYMSRAARPLDEAEISLIERKARSNNQRDDVTGLLIYDRTRFLQALEGERDVIHQTMDRIRDDERHAKIDIVTDRPVDIREFGTWSLTIKKVEPIDDAQAFLNDIKGKMDTISDVALKAMFIGFAVLGCQPGSD